ncbi:hypothetical protein VP01_3432g1 [Puccinia sorghi]|uniref:Uncharacterized protein n=1 Tax=Puccinia sorghi TaxID=27349 RepID=A0A0L6UWE9_9BASI|nr:hypothetical protein VP01_3432g1 [Puccinia sorghi]
MAEYRDSEPSCISRSNSDGDHTDNPTPTPTPQARRTSTSTTTAKSSLKTHQQLANNLKTDLSRLEEEEEKKKKKKKGEHVYDLVEDYKQDQEIDEIDWKKIEPLSSYSSSISRPSLQSTATNSPPINHTNQDLFTIATTDPSALSVSDLAPTSDPLNHSVDPEPVIHHHPQLRFDPVVRIIPNSDEENSSDEENPPRRSRSHTRKRPIRLCAKKIALPLNISTSSLIGIGHHNNHSNITLTSVSSCTGVSPRELLAQTRKEIDEDDQFIPDVPRYLNLTLPSITRQPDRRALRLEQEHRLERWRNLGGGNKSNLKLNSISNLSHLSHGLRERLNSSSIPVQLSTNTAINSVPFSITPEDLSKLDTETLTPPKQIPPAEKQAPLKFLDPAPPILRSTPSTFSETQTVPPSNSHVDLTGATESGAPSLQTSNAFKSSPFKWFAHKARSMRRQNNSTDSNQAPAFLPAELAVDSPGAPLQKSPTPACLHRSSQPMLPDPSLEGAPLKRVSTPRGPISDTTTPGVPLHRTATPTTWIRRPSSSTPQHSCTPGAPLEKTPTPGTALQRSTTTSTLLNKPKRAAFFQKLAIWRKPPPPSNCTDSLVTNPTPDPVDDVLIITNSSLPPRGHLAASRSNISLALETDNKVTSSTDKWGSRHEVPLRECCQACLRSVNVEASPNQQPNFSPGALKHLHGKNWILQDTLKQGGIPSQQIKLIAEQLGAPYTSWVAKTPSPLSTGHDKLSS